MALERIAEVVWTKPWAILPSTHEAISSQLKAAIEDRSKPPAQPQVEDDGQEREPFTGLPVVRPQLEIDPATGVGVIEINGILGRKLSQLAIACGGVDYADIQAACREAESAALAGDLASLVLVINSPGGTYAGGAETAAAIRAVSEAGARTVCVTDDLLCSGGYWLACACDQIHATATAYVGSVGVYAAYMNHVRAMEERGYRVQHFQAGKYKTMGAPWKEWEQDELDYAATEMKRLGDEFTGWVMSRRPAVERESLEGQAWYAEAAPAGIVDSLVADVVEPIVAEMRRALAA